MSRSPQDVYARYLLSSRGYPLWIPEPSHQLLLSRPDGLRIGDVGIVVPEDGGFDVFFNICLPREHPFHRATGVPDNFNPVELGDEDIRIIPRVENPGRIISTSSVTKIRKIESLSDTPGTRIGSLGYEFDLSSSGGALLILPEGAERYDLRNRRLFFEEATRHGADWYRFAEGRLGRMISHDSLYLVTGFYKTYSWSLAAFENVAGNGEFSAQFKMAHVGGSNIAGTYTCQETTRALDWRAGPVENNGLANQSVFIRGFKVALRTGFLRQNWVEVKASAPSTSSKHGRFSNFVRGESLISNVWKGLWRNSSSSGMDMRDEAVTKSVTNLASGGYRNGDAEQHVVIQPMPEIPEMFHPSDIINRYLLKREASANVAVTHDDDWIALLEKGQLKPEDFVQANSLRVEVAVTNNFYIASQEGVVSLQEKSDATADDNMICAFPGEHEADHEHQDLVVPRMQSTEWISKITTTNSGHKDGLIPEKQEAVEDNMLPDHLTTLLANPNRLINNELLEFSSIGTQGGQDMQDEDFSLPLDAEAPPPPYSTESPGLHEIPSVSEKSYLLAKSLDLASTRPFGIHRLLLPYDPRISKHLLRFDVMFPVDRICYQCSNNARERLTDEDLDEPASDEPITKMRITFEQRPFSWTIDVDNPKRIRCRDVFEAIYDGFNRQLTLDELWRVTNRAACEEAFRIRNLALGSPQIEWSLGWKRVDVLLHHTIFRGLTMNSEGDWVLHLGAPLPASDLPQSPSLSRRSSSSTDESTEGSDEHVNLLPPSRLRLRDSYSSQAGNYEDSASHATFLVTAPASLPRQQFVRSRPNRPLGPRERPN